MESYPDEQEPQSTAQTAEFLPDALAVFHQIDSLLSLFGVSESGNRENVRATWTHHDKALQLILESNLTFHPLTHAIQQQDMSALLVSVDPDHPGNGSARRLEFIIPGADLRNEVEVWYNETPFAEQRYDLISKRVEWRSADGQPHKSELNEGVLACFDVGLSLMKHDLAK